MVYVKKIFMNKVAVGKQAPDFVLKNQDGQEVRLSGFRGQPVVVYFYPKDDTPGCTREACTFRDQYEDFTDVEAIVFGISGDSVESHKKFIEKYRLPFDLLADIGDKVRSSFGVKADLFGLIPGRSTYVIDNKGIIRHIFNSQMNTTKHISESLKIINELKNE